MNPGDERNVCRAGRAREYGQSDSETTSVGYMFFDTGELAVIMQLLHKIGACAIGNEDDTSLVHIYFGFQTGLACLARLPVYCLGGVLAIFLVASQIFCTYIFTQS